MPRAGEHGRGPHTRGVALLHETAVAWLRRKLSGTVPAQAWKEGRGAYLVRPRALRAKVNEEHDVEGLCREFPQRLEELKPKKGDALKS